jgi:glycosyltransferase involved in cell wall biosynthesis
MQVILKCTIKEIRVDRVEIKKEPIVSISCITYNHAPYIRDAIEGFLMQKTNFPFEILIHDDASTDGTSDIIRKYEQKYSDLIFPVYQKENQYSKGILLCEFNLKRARGKYIALCEGDDYWTDPLKLQKQVDFMDANPDYVMCYHSYKVRKDDKISKKTFPRKEKDFDADKLVATPIDIATTTKFFINVYKYHSHDDLMRFCGDYPMNAYLGTLGKCKFLPSIAPSIYRRHNGGIWSSRDDKSKFYNNINMCIKIYELFRENKDDHRMKIRLRILKDLLQEKWHRIEPDYKTFRFNPSFIRIAFCGFRFEFHYPFCQFAKKLVNIVCRKK